MEEKKFKELDTSNHFTEYWSYYGKEWDYNLYENFWVGGYFPVPNISSGYHGIIKQWWDFYNGNKFSDVLFVSEGNDVKGAFKETYPNWQLKTTDKYFELQSEPDIVANLCEPKSLPENSFDLILCQATFEHIYDPWTAIKNLLGSLKTNGTLIIHSHPPAFGYHSIPRDYFRFMKDWWYDIPYHLDGVQMLEFYMQNNFHVFAAYKKV